MDSAFWSPRAKKAVFDSEARWRIAEQQRQRERGNKMTKKAEAQKEFDEMTDQQEEFVLEDDEFNPEPPEPEFTLYDYCRYLPESPALVWTKFYDASGFEWSITLRAGLPNGMARSAMNELLEQMDIFRKGAKHNKWTPKANGFPARATKPAPSQPPAPKRKSGNGDAPPAPQATQDEDIPRGVTLLNTLKVDSDGRVEFHCDGFQWPFKDSRGGDVVAGYFEKSLGWTPEHFAPGAKYERLDLQCHWEKITKGTKKYYNVVKVTS